MSSVTGILVGVSLFEGLMAFAYIVGTNTELAHDFGLMTIILTLWAVVSMLNDINNTLKETRKQKDA